MTIKIKNWAEFQHYGKRRPPWIKVYKTLLDDLDFHLLPGESVKVLLMLWLLASEDENLDGNLPCIEKICFRLHKTEKELLKHFEVLAHWLEVDKQDASKPLAQREQDASPETEKRQRHIQRQIMLDFDSFYSTYPKKVQRGKAEEAYKKACNNGLPEISSLLAIVEKHKAHWKNKDTEKKFIPHPATWLNGKQWLDEIDAPQSTGAVKMKVNQSFEDLTK